MMNYLIYMSYDGTNYYGFQRLKKYPTIQNELEKSLSKIFKQDISVKGAGRTDKGVHALCQCASFNAPFYIEPGNLTRAINRYLPMDIRIEKTEIKEDDFHARFSVKKKVYKYLINNGEFNPFFNNYYYQDDSKISIKKLKKISKLFIGTHDFNNFISGKVDKSISNIFKINIEKKNNIIIINITGTHFYKYMVRNIVGAMLDYNRGKASFDTIKRMLENPKKPAQLTTISPSGLYLSKIYY